MSSLPPVIEHRRDLILDGEGQVEQDYNHLIYDFGNVIARAYLDEPGKVAIQSGEADGEVMAYLRERFDRIDRLTRDSYVTVWRA